ncbi:OmpA family protein [Bradyrhizobium erythrophlei]|uniref:OmpA family protein n=1 Tax=Bradyrhizobium erythrophlei TaxID=1437360 RepID=UPI0035ECD8BC
MPPPCRRLRIAPPSAPWRRRCDAPGDRYRSTPRFASNPPESPMFSRRRKILPASAYLVAAAWLALAAQPAAAADRAGCRDFEGMMRFQNASIALCDSRNFAEYTLPTGRITGFDFRTNTAEIEDKQELEGRLTQLLYTIPKGASSAEVFRSYKEYLASAGYRVLYEAKGPGFGAAQGSFFESMGPGGQIVAYSPDQSRYLAAVKEDGGAKTSIALYIVEYDGGYNPDLTVEKGQVVVRLDAVQSGELKNGMVAVSAADIAKRLDSAGQVILSGILFDFNKAQLKPDSRTALDEIAAFLKKDSARKVYLVGHTDNVGGFDFNMQLSQARADAVVADLVATYGINPARLKGHGAGLLAPIASNANEDGRAKNRRVELIPQ